MTVTTLTTPRRVRELRQAYEAVLRSRDPDLDQAPLEWQHAWWRRHDAAKHEYAIADWKWESLVLRVLIGSAALVAVGSVFMTELTVIAVFIAVAALWRCYIVLTKHAPE